MSNNEQNMQSPALGDFNIRAVHVIDPKTKRLARTNPYKMIITDGVRYIEHPVGSGNLYWEDRTQAGRLEGSKIIRGKAHELYTRPLTSDEKLGREMANTRQENARLMKELAEIKAEKALAAKPLKEQIVVPKPTPIDKVAAENKVKPEIKAAPKAKGK